MPKQSKSRSGLRVVSRPGSSSLYIRGTVRGRSIYESAGTDDPALAEEARATREVELYRGALHGEKPKVTWAQAALAYLKRPDGVSTHTRMAIGRLTQHYGPTVTCDQIGQAEIDRAGRALCKADAKAVTILRAVTTPTKAVLMFAARRGWCGVPVFEHAKGGGKRTEWFTPAEADALIAAAADHLRPLLAFLFCTGARIGEAVALDWADVDLQNGRATLRQTKNGDDRIVDLPARAVVALANLPADADGKRAGRVFLCPDGNPAGKNVQWVPYRLSCDNRFGSGGGQIKRAWATALKGAEIGRHLTPHHARHTWASWSYAAHKDIVRLRQDGGWRSISQCERYTKLVPEGLRPAIEAFWSGVSAATAPIADEQRLTA